MDRVKLRQKRIMSYFIEAANAIIEEKGISAVTIRSVAERAGYTSATLYNYFDNLSHLIFLATMNHLEEYHEALPRWTASCKDPVEVYLAVSACFCTYSFRHPEIYELLFFSQRDRQEAYVNQYYELFPDRLRNGSVAVSRIMPVSNLRSRNSILLEDCINAGLITRADATDFSEVAMMVYKCILQDVIAGRLSSEDATEKATGHFRRLMKCYSMACYTAAPQEQALSSCRGSV